MRARRTPPPNLERRALSIEEAAQAMALGQNTLRTLIAQGRVHAIKAGSRVIVPIASVERFLAGESGGG